MAGMASRCSSSAGVRTASLPRSGEEGRGDPESESEQHADRDVELVTRGPGGGRDDGGIDHFTRIRRDAQQREELVLQEQLGAG